MRRNAKGAKNGQIAIEYLFVVGLVFLLVIPLVIVFYTQSNSLQDEVIASQSHYVLTELVDAIDEVYYHGPPTKQTIKLYFPKKITQTAINGEAVSLFIDSSNGGTYEATAYAVTNVTGTLETHDGVHVITISAGNNNVTVSDG